MREHMGLYRGKRKDNGEWVEGVYMPAVDNDPPYIFRSPRYAMGYEVDPDTVGECTGLRDKNGKLIFEGDIVRFRTRVCTFEPLCVKWYEESCQFIASTRNGVHAYPMDKSWEYEIIGNVHDNPELLKGGEG